MTIKVQCFQRGKRNLYFSYLGSFMVKKSNVHKDNAKKSIYRLKKRAMFECIFVCIIFPPHSSVIVLYNSFNIQTFGYATDIHTTQKMKFFIEDFFSKCDQIRSFRQIWSHLLKKSLMGGICAVHACYLIYYCRIVVILVIDGL